MSLDFDLFMYWYIVTYFYWHRNELLGCRVLLQEYCWVGHTEVGYATRATVQSQRKMNMEQFTGVKLLAEQCLPLCPTLPFFWFMPCLSPCPFFDCLPNVSWWVLPNWQGFIPLPTKLPIIRMFHFICLCFFSGYGLKLKGKIKNDMPVCHYQSNPDFI